MIKILPCSICGSTDVIRERESGDCRIEYWTEYECFDKGECYDNGPTFRTAESWNKYAAAMNLAKVTAEYGKKWGFEEIEIDGDEDDEEVKHLNNCARKVLEVFNG